jgi:hypothetical protein
MGHEVPATATPVSKQEAISLLTVALTDQLGQPPPEQVGVYSLALAWVETSQGRSIIQNNAGNVSCNDDGRGWSGNYWRPPWFTGDNPKFAALHLRMLEGQAPRAFRAYPSQQAGWNDFVHEVVRRKPLLAAMMSDDPLAVAMALHDTNYSKDYGAQHAETFRSLVAGFRAAGDFRQFKGLPLEGVSPAKRSSSSGLGTLLFVGVMGAAGVLIWVKLNPAASRRLARA